MKTIEMLLPKEYREFFRVLDSCEEKVELVTQDGICLNMKSKLAQYVAMARVFADKDIAECELVTYSDADTARILSYFLREAQLF